MAGYRFLLGFAFLGLTRCARSRGWARARVVVIVIVIVVKVVVEEVEEVIARAREGEPRRAVAERREAHSPVSSSR